MKLKIAVLLLVSTGTVAADKYYSYRVERVTPGNIWN